MKILKINSKKYGINEVLIDNEDFERVIQYKWSIHKQLPNKLRVYNFYHGHIHRFILNITNSKIHVDHINGNPLDNRKENLRLCSNKENTKSKNKSKSNTSGYKGVFFIKYRNKCWNARIGIDYKTIHLGYFYTKEDAAKAYNEAAIKYFGEFAKLNIIKCQKT